MGGGWSKQENMVSDVCIGIFGGCKVFRDSGKRLVDLQPQQN